MRALRQSGFEVSPKAIEVYCTAGAGNASATTCASSPCAVSATAWRKCLL